MSDRDLNLRRPQAKRDRKCASLVERSRSFYRLGMPEWMDDNNDDDKQLSSATFEQDGTFTGSSVLRQNSNEPPKLQSQTSTDETASRGSVVSNSKYSGNLDHCVHLQTSSKQQEENKLQNSTPSQTGTAAVDIPKSSKTIGRSSFLM